MSALSAPSAKFIAVVPSNTIAFAEMCRGLYVGTTGDVCVAGMDGNPVTFTAVPAGALLPIRISRVNVTGTTASNLVALF